MIADDPLGLIVFHRVLPFSHALLPIRRALFQFGFHVAHPPLQLRDDALLFICVSRDAAFVVAIDEREQPIIFLLRQGIIFVVVALGALNREPEHALADRVHAIEHRVHPELLGVHAAFFIEHRVAQKTGRHNLVLRGIGQQIAGELLDNELIIRQIAIERVDHVITIEPDVARFILFEPIRIRVARRIKPMAAPAFAVMR